MVTSILNTFRVDTRGRALSGTSHGVTIATIIVDVFQVERMNVTGEVSVDSTQLALTRSSTKNLNWIRRPAYPRMVKRTLIQKSAPQPEMRKTPSGGTGRLLVELSNGILASRQQGSRERRFVTEVRGRIGTSRVNDENKKTVRTD